MEIALGWLTRVPGAVIFLLSTGLVIGALVLLSDWWGGRRQEMVRQQIALTDAIYERFGPIASPVVRKSLWGPRQIQFAVRPGAVHKVLVAAQEALSVADRMKLGRYEIVLIPQQAPALEAQESRADQPAVRWSRDTKAAA
ncbi:MAG: hypothetical protein ABSD47_17220 [Candidatus Methylomirabilota bacterium]|jgi:hypothetical protein